MNVHKQKLYLLTQHSESFEIRLAIITLRVNSWLWNSNSEINVLENATLPVHQGLSHSFVAWFLFDGNITSIKNGEPIRSKLFEHLHTLHGGTELSKDQSTGLMSCLVIYEKAIDLSSFQYWIVTKDNEIRRSTTCWDTYKGVDICLIPCHEMGGHQEFLYRDVCI